VEVLGYHQLNDEERQYLEEFFRLARVLSLVQALLDQAVVLRQQRQMSLGDALVAGTALAHGLTLVTQDLERRQPRQSRLCARPYRRKVGETGTWLTSEFGVDGATSGGPGCGKLTRVHNGGQPTYRKS
jgi:hypothetical protein